MNEKHTTRPYAPPGASASSSPPPGGRGSTSTGAGGGGVSKGEKKGSTGSGGSASPAVVKIAGAEKLLVDLNDLNDRFAILEARGKATV